MWDFKLLTATRTVEATMPFMLYRLAVCLGVAAACLLAALIGAGSFIAFASFSAKPGSMAGFGAALGLGAFAYLLYRFRIGLFFNIKAGHLALLAELANGAKLPQGKAQVEWAQQKAAALFPSASGFQEIDAAVRQVLRAQPAKRCPFLGGLANRDLAAHLGRLAGWLAQTGDQALLALCFLAQDAKPWQSARDGLILHVRHFDRLSKNLWYLLGFECLGFLAAYVAMLYPVNSAVSLLPVDIGVWRHVFALIFAYALKAAFLEPIATAALAGLYFELAKQESVANAAEIQELEACCGAFKTMADKAGA